MDALLMNIQIKAKVPKQWPDVKVSMTAIPDARMSPGLKFQPPMIKHDLSPEK
jgi:hypothetical protein